MNLDVLLPILLAVFSLLLMGVALEMANNPPTSDKQKWVYRWIFMVLAFLSVGLTFLQAQRAATQQAAAQRDARNAAVQNAGAIGGLQGKLDVLQRSMTDAMEAFRVGTNDPKLKQLANAYTQLAQTIGNSAQSTQPTQPIPPQPSPSPSQATPLTNKELKDKALAIFSRAVYVSTEDSRQERVLQSDRDKMLYMNRNDAQGRDRVLAQFDERKSNLVKGEMAEFNRLREQTLPLIPQLTTRIPASAAKAVELPTAFVNVSSIMTLGMRVRELADKIPDR